MVVMEQLRCYAGCMSTPGNMIYTGVERPWIDPRGEGGGDCANVNRSARALLSRMFCSCIAVE